MGTITKEITPNVNSSILFDSGLGNETFYETLEVSTDSSRTQIREAYIRLKNTYARTNPAIYSLISEDEAEQSLKKLDEAYNVLYDDFLRKDYDQLLFMKKSERGGDSPFLEGQSGVSHKIPLEETGQTQNPSFWNGAAALKKKTVASKIRFSDASLCGDVQDKINKCVAEATTIDGDFMKQLREVQSVSLEELQEKTKVSLQYIIALENNDYRTLPAIVYVKGFLNICLQYLGVQKGSEAIVSKYLESLKDWQKTKEI